jgi:hypothetical protein
MDKNTVITPISKLGTTNDFRYFGTIRVKIANGKKGLCNPEFQDTCDDEQTMSMELYGRQFQTD